MTILGLAGRIHSGKDSIGAVLVRDHGFKRVAFADGVRELVAEIGGWSSEYVFSDTFKGQIVQTNVSALGNRKVETDPSRLTGREILQRTGMACRKVFGDDVWIKIALAKCVPHGECSVCKRPIEHHLYRDHEYGDRKHYVITDVRFPNELAAIKAAGGKVIRLNRAESLTTRHGFYVDPVTRGVPPVACCDYTFPDGDYCGFPAAAHPASYSADRHASEVSLPDESNDTIKYDAVYTSSLEQNTARVIDAVSGWLK